jgi:transposase
MRVAHRGICVSPDGNFRKPQDNCNAFRQVFREFVLLCRQLDLFGRELLAVDGTRIKAVNN